MLLLIWVFRASLESKTYLPLVPQSPLKLDRSYFLVVRSRAGGRMVRVGLMLFSVGMGYGGSPGVATLLDEWVLNATCTLICATLYALDTL
jgi:hypothetical protein